MLVGLGHVYFALTAGSKTSLIFIQFCFILRQFHRRKMSTHVSPSYITSMPAEFLIEKLSKFNQQTTSNPREFAKVCQLTIFELLAGQEFVLVEKIYNLTQKNNIWRPLDGTVFQQQQCSRIKNLVVTKILKTSPSNFM